MEYILVSACLLGKPVRYNGSAALCNDDLLQQWVSERRVVLVCPEVEGGMSIPRPRAEISKAKGGGGVLSRISQVIEENGTDVTAEFVRGAHEALAKCKARGIRLAILKEGSPSCGTAYTYDGTFSGKRISLPGVTTALLQQAGISVFNELQLSSVQREITRLETERAGCDTSQETPDN